MGEGTIGRSGPLLRAPGAVERSGGATDREQRQPRHPPRHGKDEPKPQDRRSADANNRRRRRLLDLLFDEIDHIPDLDVRQKERLRRNLRSRVGQHDAVLPRPPPQTATPPPPIATPPADEPEHRPSDHPEVPVDPDRIATEVTTVDEDLPAEEMEENAVLAAQLRDCLTRRTETARKIAIYLHLLLSVDGALRPHVVIEV